MERPLVSYEPHFALAWLYKRFFDHIEIDQAWTTAVREADKRGTVVYVQRNLSFIDFFALDHLTKRLGLPQVRFANDLGLWIWEPMGRGWLHALLTRNEASDADDLRRAVTQGSSAALFLKRPANLLAPAERGRGKIEGDVFLETLLSVQRSQSKPILLVPQVFVWSKHPDLAKHTAFDTLLGSREWPGKIRTVAQFLMNYRDVTLRAGEPLDLSAFLAKELHNGSTPDDAVLVRRLTYALLRRLERERRAVVGPMQKPADRLREEVVRSPKLQKIIHDMAGEGEAERRVLTARALAMVREMEASLDMNAAAAWDAAVHSIVSTMYSGLDVDMAGLERLRVASKEGSLVLLPSHKSHLDYLFIAHLFYRNHLPLPLVAAGDNLSFFPLGPALRRAGGFFIRRSFHGDRLYGAVVDAYMRRLILDGSSLEFFLEGGRSRTGKLLLPKMGLLSLVVDAALGVTGRKVFFVPISIGYERVMEEKEYVRELLGGEKKKEDVRGLLAGAGVFAGKYGRLNFQVGSLLTLDQILEELDRRPKKGKAPSEGPKPLTPARRRAMVTRLGYRVMNEINRATAVTPGALVATAILNHGRRGIAHEDLLDMCAGLAETLHRAGARFSPSLVHEGAPGKLRKEVLIEAVQLFAKAGHVTVRHPGDSLDLPDVQVSDDTIYLVPDDARLSLDLSKNILLHFFIARALVGTAILAPPGIPSHEPGRVPEDAVKERVQALSRLFKHEFLFRADKSFDDIFEETVAQMIEDGELAREGALLVRGKGHGVALYAEMIRAFLEGYRVAARSLGALVKGPMASKDLAKRALTVGQRMFLAEEIVRPEAVNRPVMENAYCAFCDQGYLVRKDGKLALAESYATADAVRTVETKLAAYLPKMG